MSLDPSQYEAYKICKMGDDNFRKEVVRVLQLQRTVNQENQLLDYRPVTSDAEKVHTTTKRTVGVYGGNGSSKTESCIVEMVMLCTGVTPASLVDKFDPVKKFRGPVNCRIVCESLTTTLYNVILPKLKYWEWTGIDEPGGQRGHWGWVPRTCLIDGSWKKSWSDKLRTLTILHRDYKNTNKVVGYSKIQFMSKDQDASDFASGEYHMILHDEAPSLAIWREDEARTMRVNGRMFLAMTWADDPTVPLDWIYDLVYEPGQPGVSQHPEIDSINLFTTDNPHLDQEAISIKSSQWSEEVRQVRIFGQPMRFSSRVHPLFTDQTRTWCFKCNKAVIEVDDACTCGSGDIEDYCHVAEFETELNWPTVFVLDMHPRKPHMGMYVQISPNDDLFQIDEILMTADPLEFREGCDEIEEEHNVYVSQRLCDPNMGLSPAGAKRGITWQQEFDRAGLYCDLADDSDVGRKRVDEYLKPDNLSRCPRITIHHRCSETIKQMKRFQWDDFRMTAERDQKQKAKDKYSDFPAMYRYLMNSNPSFRFLHQGPQVIHSWGARR